MKRSQLEHIIRASADIADDDEIIIIGSQSIYLRMVIRGDFRAPA